MSLHRYATKRDANEGEIIAALEAAGCVVQQLSAKGVPDLLVGFRDMLEGTSHNVLMEVKMPGEHLTEPQKEWHNKWPVYVHIVHTIEEALYVIGRVK